MPIHLPLSFYAHDATNGMSKTCRSEAITVSYEGAVNLSFGSTMLMNLRFNVLRHVAHLEVQLVVTE